MKKGIQCKSCGDRLFSMYRHDFRGCSCGRTYVDGGEDYMRVGGYSNTIGAEMTAVDFDREKKRLVAEGRELDKWTFEVYTEALKKRREREEADSS